VQCGTPGLIGALQSQLSPGHRCLGCAQARLSLGEIFPRDAEGFSGIPSIDAAVGDTLGLLPRSGDILFLLGDDSTGVIGFSPEGDNIDPLHGGGLSRSLGAQPR
jgi:hypothetical protein